MYRVTPDSASLSKKSNGNQTYLPNCVVRAGWKELIYMEWEIVGILAAIGTTSGFIPQIIRGIRTKRLDDVSPVMYIFLILGLSLWLSYGVHLKDVIIISANGVAIAFSVFILILRFKYMRQKITL